MLAAKGIAVDGCVFQPEREGCDDILVKTLTMNIRDLHFFFWQQHFRELNYKSWPIPCPSTPGEISPFRVKFIDSMIGIINWNKVLLLQACSMFVFLFSTTAASPLRGEDGVQCHKILSHRKNCSIPIRSKEWISIKIARNMFVGETILLVCLFYSFNSH